MHKALLKLPAFDWFGRFELLRKIDSGGMAEVFLARERVNGDQKRLVALKRLHSHLADDPLYVSMFQDEARLAGLIKHPGVCRAYGYGEESGHHYLALEWIHGVSLASLCDRISGGLPISVTLRILADVASALHHTHLLHDGAGQLLGVIHRDISPPNVMISFDGIVKVLDFGMAKATTQTVSTQTGCVKGRFRYFAPEQLEEQSVIDWRLDVFALGLCGFEALTGRPLFDHDDPIEAARAIQYYTEPPSICALRPETPPALEAVLHQALAREPDRRYQSAGKLERALRDILLATETSFGSMRLQEYVRGAFPVEAVSVM